LIQSYSLTIGDVDNLTDSLAGLSRFQISVDDVFYVGKISRLFTVAVDYGTLATKQIANET
jgi:hypothetical protein